jgi:hypothetical protein
MSRVFKPCGGFRQKTRQLVLAIDIGAFPGECGLVISSCSNSELLANVK